MKRRLTWPRLLTGACAFLLFAAWYVPKISADRYREPIRAALQDALGRKVGLSSVQFRLLPVPGFTVDNVIIGEDPAIGSEPVAYVTTLRARPRLTALFGGPLEFASVNLEGTSVNLTRIEQNGTGVRWNFSSLLSTKLPAGFPSIHIAGGRVNFKFGDTKSIFYLLNTDVDIWPPSDADGSWTLRLRAEPARTDRPARGFGFFTARGQWLQQSTTLTADVKLERSELGDIVTLIQGSESGLHGHIWGDAHLAGPPSRVGLAGRVTVDDIHSWNQAPSPVRLTWPLSLGGVIDLPGQIADLRAVAPGKQSPFDVRYRVTEYLARPHWAVIAVLNQLPLSPLLGIGRSFGWKIPPDLALDGKVQGALAYSVPEGSPRMDGEMRVSNSTLAVSGIPPLRISDAQLQFAGSSVTLAPVQIANASDETATVGGNFDAASGSLALSIASEGMSIASFRRQIAAAGAPLLRQAISGTWSGDLSYSQRGWTGDVHLRDADIPFEAFAQPLHILSADARLDEATVTVKPLNLSIGGIAAQGEYRYQPDEPRPHQFRINIPGTTGDGLEKLLMPTLHRGTFLNYAFNFGRVPEPDWMRAMHADGTVQISALNFAGKAFTKLKVRIYWDGDSVRLTGLQAQSEKAVFSGDGIIDLAQRQPRYQLNGRISGIQWQSGWLDAEGTVTTSGTGAELLSNMNAQGEIKGRNVNNWRALDGCFDWISNKLRLTDLVINSQGETYLGTAETQQNGRVLVRASDGSKKIETDLALR